MSILDDHFQTYGMAVLQHWAGVTVTLRRGGRETTGVRATWSRPPEMIDVEGVPFRVTHRTYRIAVSSYAIGGEAVEPRKGDLITETIGGASVVFEILSEGGSPAFELDGDGYHWIVRTKKVG